MASTCTFQQIVDDPLINPQNNRAFTVKPIVGASSAFFFNGTVWVEILNQAAQILTDPTGSASCIVPWQAICYPAGLLYTITSPDGFIWKGAVPSVNGPLTIHDLVITYNWVLGP